MILTPPCGQAPSQAFYTGAYTWYVTTFFSLLCAIWLVEYCMGFVLGQAIELDLISFSTGKKVEGGPFDHQKGYAVDHGAWMDKTYEGCQL